MHVERTAVATSASRDAGSSFSSGLSGSEDSKYLQILKPKLDGRLKNATRRISRKTGGLYGLPAVIDLFCPVNGSMRSNET